MVMQDVRYTAPTAVPVIDEEGFDEMVQQRAVYWTNLAGEVLSLYPVEGVNRKWFEEAKDAAKRFRQGDRTQECILAMARGRTDWFLAGQELRGRVVYLRGQRDAA